MNEHSEVDRLKHIIDRDRYVVAAGISAVQTSIKARRWLLEGRGPYTYEDDDAYHKEFSIWLDEVTGSLDVLSRVAICKTDCTTDPDKVQLAREAAAEFIKQPVAHREMIAADLWSFDNRDLEIKELKEKLALAQSELNKYKPNRGVTYCNKCGFFGKVDMTGNHVQPNGQPCPYIALAPSLLDKPTDNDIKNNVETMTMMCETLGSIEPNQLIAAFQSKLMFDTIIEVFQVGLETGKITLDSEGYVVAVKPSSN